MSASDMFFSAINSMLRQARESLKSGFARAVGVLAAGTFIAYIINFAVLLVTVRIYGPEDFKILAVIGGFASSLGALACLRLELAVPLPERDQDAMGLLKLSLASAALASAGVASLVIHAPHWVADDLLHQPAAQPSLWMLPAGVLAYAWFSALQMWSVRLKAFGLLAFSKMVQAALTGATQIGFGLAGFIPFGLLLGAIVNTGSGALVLAGASKRGNATFAHPLFDFRELTRLLGRHWKYPTYSMMETLCNLAAGQLPILIIAAAGVGPEAGHLFLATTVMTAPIGLLGAAVSQVYSSRAAQAARDGDLGRLTANVLAGLFKTGVGPLLCAGIAAPQVFAVLFGANWTRAGELVMWLTPAVIAQFLAVPLGIAYYAIGRQFLSFLVQLLGACARIGLVLVAWSADPRYMAPAFALGGALYYGLFLGGVVISARVPLASLWITFRSSVTVLIAWMAVGLVAARALEFVPRHIGN